MTGPSSPHIERRAGLTDKGLIVASCYRLRNAVEQLDEAEQAALAVELRNLVARACRPFLKPIA